MPSIAISNKELLNNLAIITTSSPHGVTSGTYITITNVDPTFNGSYTVSTTPSSNILTYSKIASNVASQASSGSVVYAVVSQTSKPAYMYDKTTDSWFPISGQIDTAKNYTWTGSHIFESSVDFESPVSFDLINVSNSASVGGNLQVTGSANFNSDMNINGGINVYATATARNSAIPSPKVGTMSYISGTKKLEIWDGTAWDQVLTVDQ